MSENRSKPAIRFAGFTDDWEQRKVGDVITEVSRPIEMQDDQKYQLVTVKRRNEGIVSRGFYYGRDILVKNYYEVHSGDYLISKRQLVHGANGQVPESLDKSIVSNEYMICIGNENLTAEFLTLLSKTQKLKRDFFLSSYGVDIEKLVFDVNDWKKRSLIFPNKNEQKKISDFFIALDTLITLHQRKYDKLVKVKKTMLDKMFPKGNARVPEIRFAGFTDDWEQRKVGDVITEVSRPIEMQDDQKYQLVTVKRRNEGIVSRGFYYGRDILVKNYYEVHSGDYLISKRQLVHGANGQVPESLDKSIVSNEYMICIGNENLTAEFLTLLSKTQKLKRDFFLSSYGVDIEKLVFDVNDWKKRSLIFPNKNEQKKISDFFIALDTLITLHQRKLEKLKKIKSAMLEKMFV